MSSFSRNRRQRAPRGTRQGNNLGGGPYRWKNQWRGYVSIGLQRDGRYGRKWFYGATATECRRLMEEYRRTLEDYGGTLPETEQTLHQWTQYWLKTIARRVQPRTVAIRRVDLARVQARLMRTKLERISPLLIEQELLAVADEVSADAANKVRATLRASLQAAVDHGLITSNPVRSVKRFQHEAKTPIVWTSAQVSAFIQATGEIMTRRGRFRTWQEPAARYHAVFYTALTTGARIGELLALNWEDIDGSHLEISKTWSGGELKIPKTKSAVRILTLPDDTIEELEAHRENLKLLEVDSEAVFPSLTGTRLQRRNVGRALEEWAERAEVPVLTPHELRHTYASMAIANGMSPVDLARQLGHKDASFTLRTYTHFFERACIRAAPSLLQLINGDSES